MNKEQYGKFPYFRLDYNIHKVYNSLIDRKEVDIRGQADIAIQR